MKKFALAPLAITAALALSACGGNTAENTTVSNDVVLNEELSVVDNSTAVESLNASDTILDNAAADTLNAADAAGNTVANTL